MPSNLSIPSASIDKAGVSSRRSACQDLTSPYACPAPDGPRRNGLAVGVTAEIKGKLSVVDVVGETVQLKRAGSNYKGLCPFHGEKTPSFTVSPSKGFYHCFGCSVHGTAIGFLIAYDNLEFPEAVEALAEMMGLEVPRETTGVPERKEENEELYA